MPSSLLSRPLRQWWWRLRANSAVAVAAVVLLLDGSSGSIGTSAFRHVVVNSRRYSSASSLLKSSYRHYKGIGKKGNECNHRSYRTAAAAAAASDAAGSTGGNADILPNIRVMVNGMPGPMATAAAEACLRKGLRLTPVAMTGPDIEPCTISVVDVGTGKRSDVRLIPSTETDELQSAVDKLRSRSADDGSILIAVDYTHPSAVNSNAAWYVEQNLPFVMGTTGGDREALIRDVTAAKLPAVIAPNMGKQIVAMQTCLEQLATQFPDSFAGYTLRVRESHQVTKADTSGTAKAVVDSIKRLTGGGGAGGSGEGNNEFAYDDIERIRDEKEAMEFGVPESALKGHAFHTYTLTSPDGSIQFQLQHNVAGRTMYAEGTADAVAFLGSRLLLQASSGKEEEEEAEDDEPRVYTMMDVLRQGALK